MIIKFNFNYSGISSNQAVTGVLKITKLDELLIPIYDLIINEEGKQMDKSVLFDHVLKQYVELRIFELFSQSRNQKRFLTKNDYKDIISKEAPQHLVSHVLDNMNTEFANVDMRQAS